MPSPKLLVFTDLDGSLLDHDTYSHAPADELLRVLENNQIPVIPCTSKTQAELEAIRLELGNHHPFIAENGAAVFIPKDYFSRVPSGIRETEAYWIKEFAKPRAHWQALLKKVESEVPNTFITFDQAGIRGIIEMTGLESAQAELAAQRAYGEPLKWLGSESQWDHFSKLMHQSGAKLLRGGRFTHVSGACDKGQALLWLQQQYASHTRSRPCPTVALGDSENDIAMLQAAEYSIIIRSPAHKPPTITQRARQRVYTTKQTGPRGWVEGLNRVLEELTIIRD